MITKWIVPLLAAGTLLAGECTYRIADAEITWEAFKTPAKTGVQGTFGNVKLSAMPDKSEKGLIEGAKAVIDTASIDSKNRGRDAKLVKAFFQVQGVDRIEAVITRVRDGWVDLNITMNGITKEVPMKSETDEREMEAKGWIDLGDFDMLPSLASLNKACYKKHAGKTWQDVALEFKLKTIKKCR
ncbi:YceI family protein [Hydrogenimonas sp. SS33]|uniref:YceI family protein n=1 Tax=Hydrogenimonas leucolamina TaxID=2954236 RepID=UPI00336C1344